ncbi:hypothetical protein AHAS_Ahas11G0071800 [Arachis hypogaea]
MQRSIPPNFKIPTASLQGVVGIVILFCVPIYDRVFVPIARKFIGQRSGITESEADVPISIWWLLPQYIINGTSDALIVIGFQELYYNQMPEGMRSLGAAALSVIFGLRSFVNNGIVVVVVAIISRFGDKWLQNNLNKAHLHHFYWVLAWLSASNLCVYVCIKHINT